jgi:TolB protein
VIARLLIFACLLLVLAPAGGAVRPTAPAAGVIAFVREEPRPRFDINAAVDLWVVRTDGRGLRKIVGTRGWDEEPAWSPDGSRIAFHKAFLEAGDREDALKGIDVWTVRADGRGRRKVTHDGSSSSPAWSPGGNALAVARGDGVVVLRADGTRRRQIARRTDPTAPAWEPDGRRIAFAVPGELWVVEANGTGARRLARGASSDTRVVWSPDGRFLAYIGTSARASGLLVVRSSGGRPRLLSVLAEEARWSPDGGRLVLVRPGIPREAGLFLAAPDGRGPKRLTQGLDTSPVWSPDGRRIAFRRGLLVGDIYIVNADGSGLRNVTRTPKLDERQPAWRPR